MTNKPTSNQEVGNKPIIVKVTEARDRLYDCLPSGDIDAFELLKLIKVHLEDLDRIIGEYDGKKNRYIMPLSRGTIPDRRVYRRRVSISS